jgi:hypothetical protein
MLYLSNGEGLSYSLGNSLQQSKQAKQESPSAGILNSLYHQAVTHLLAQIDVFRSSIGHRHAGIKALLTHNLYLRTKTNAQFI